MVSWECAPRDIDWNCCWSRFERCRRERRPLSRKIQLAVGVDIIIPYQYMPFSWPFSYGPLRWISINWPIAQNFNFEVSTPLIGPSTPSTIVPPPSPSPFEDVLGAAANLGFTPREAQSNRYRARIFETKVVRSISPASGVFWVGNWLIRSINTFAWFNALLYQFTFTHLQ